MLSEKLIKRAQENRLLSSPDYQKELESMIERYKQQFDLKELNSKQLEIYDSRLASYVKLAENFMTKFLEADVQPSWLVTGGANYNQSKFNKQMDKQNKIMCDYEEKKQKYITNTKRMLASAINEEQQNTIVYEEMKRTFDLWSEYGLNQSSKTLFVKRLETKIKNGISPKIIESFFFELGFDKYFTQRNRVYRLFSYEKELKNDRVYQFEDGEILVNYTAERVQILFNEKPEKEIREKLKSKAFRWSPKNKAWQRQITLATKFAVYDLFSVNIEIK